MTTGPGEGLPYGEQAAQRFESVDAVQTHLREVFGERNSIYLPGRSPRIELLELGVSDLSKAARVEDEDAIKTTLARVTSRVFCIANGLNDVPISEGLEMKFPLSGCAYCGQLPCACGEKRPSPHLNLETGGPQSSWSLRDWQSFLGAVYGPKNSARESSLDYAQMRLSLEVTELRMVEHSILGRVANQVKLADVYKQYALELADCMGWTFAIANILGEDVQTAVEERYGAGCATCGNAHCSCNQADFDHVYGLSE